MLLCGNKIKLDQVKTVVENTICLVLFTRVRVRFIRDQIITVFYTSHHHFTHCLQVLLSIIAYVNKLLLHAPCIKPFVAPGAAE